MRCAACGAINDEGRIYCGGCARSLGEFCPVCQFLNGAGVRFCGGCARDLLAAAPEPAPPTAAASATAPDAGHTTRAGISAAIFEDLRDLLPGPGPAAGGTAPPAAAADATQAEVDGFFGRLLKEGVVEIRSPGAAGQAPLLPRKRPP